MENNIANPPTRTIAKTLKTQPENWLSTTQPQIDKISEEDRQTNDTHNEEAK